MTNAPFSWVSLKIMMDDHEHLKMSSRLGMADGAHVRMDSARQLAPFSSWQPPSHWCM
jgi:hypothetical protein